MTLRIKTIIGIALIEALALAILIISGLSWLKSSNEQSLELGSKQLVNVFAKASRDAVIATDLAYLESFAKSVVSEHNLAYIRITDSDGIMLTEQGNYDANEVNTNLSPFESRNGIYDVAGSILLGSTSYGLVEMGVKVDSIHQILHLATKASILIALLEMTFVALFSFALGSYLMNRLDSLRQGVVKITQQGPGAELPLSGNDEVTRVVEAFNQMSTSLSKAQTDLKQQYQKQKSLSIKVAQLAQVAEHARDAIIITDIDGRITWVNTAFEELTKYLSHEALGKMPHQLLQGPETDPQYQRTFIESIKNHEPIRVQLLNYTKNHQPYWGERDLSPIIDSSGYTQGLIIVERDISERIEIEKQLSQEVKKAAQATRAKSEFLANMSHEIRTPMNAIMGFSEILLENEKNTEKKELLQLIYAASDNLVNIINDILDYSKVDAGKLQLIEEEFNIIKLIESSMALCAFQANQKGLTLLIDSHSDTPSIVLGDRGRINQILINLLGNAVKFTDNGHILLKLKVETTKRSNTYRYHFEIIDTGIGISEQHLPKIINKFEQVDNSVTRNYQGTGLGLAISRQLIALHGGELSITSRFGEGSCFSFALPLKVKVTYKESTSLLYNKNILLIDSYEPRVNIIRALAESMQFSLTVVPSVAEVLSQTFLAGPFDRIIVQPTSYEDVGKLIERRKALTKSSQKLIVMLPYSPNLLTKAQKEQSDFLQQPITRNQLIKTIIGREKDHTGNNIKSEICLSGKKILLVEDNRINRILISKMLPVNSIELILAENGVIGLDLYQRTKPDIVITDISMPDKDGFTLAQDIRLLQQKNEYPWCPIIALSAHAFEEDKAQSTQYGINAYLTKPIKKNDLNDMIAKWLMIENQ
ncbi:hybrid sensor histidine kinase/response regulator [Vibrio agarivorans]|nr:hybrid sensor histidine kinase/response regulator [Vibrio agarivorans]